MNREYKKMGSLFLTSMFVLLMIGGLFIVPTGNLQSTYSNEDIELFGETKENETLIQPDIFEPSVEGGKSSEGITSFSETLTDDTGLDPDSDTNADAVYSEWDFSETIGDDVMYYSDNENLQTFDATEDMDSYFWDSRGFEANDSFSVNASMVTFTTSSVVDGIYWGDNVYTNALNFTGADSGFTRITFDYMLNDSVSYGTLVFYLTDTDDVWGSNQETLYAPSHPWATSWYTFDAAITLDDAQQFLIYLTHSSLGGPPVFELYLRNLKVYNPTRPSNITGYSESFADVSDWSLISNEGNDALSTDGDVMTWTVEDNDNADLLQTNTPSGYIDFIEMRFRFNESGAANSLYATTSDNRAGTSYTIDSSLTSPAVGTDWVTQRWYLGKTIECLYFYSNPTIDFEFYVDYLRGGLVNGWSHDGSTTEGITELSGSDDWSSSVSTDGDILTFTLSKTADTGDNYGQVTIPFDTTSTEIDIETDYYPFLAVRYRVTAISGMVFSMNYRVDGKAGALDSISTTQVWTTERENVYEQTSSTSSKYIYLQWSGSDIGDYATVEMDFVKLYGFNNWTFTDGFGEDTTSVAYYDSTTDSLVMEHTQDTGSDYWALSTRNTTIDYYVSDMVMLYTIKASANSSLRIKSRLDSDSSTEITYYLYDNWQTIAMPLSTTSGQIDYLRFYLYDWSTASPSSGTYQIYIKNNVTIRPSWYDASSESGTFGESFAVVSDWTQNVGETWGTDGDRMYVDVPEDAGSDSYYTSDISLSAGSYYYEYRVETNITTSALISVNVWSDDGMTQNYKWLGNDQVGTVGSAITVKKYIDYAYDIESVHLSFTVPVGIGDLQYEVDYFRIAPATQMGYQIDCSNLDEWKLASGTTGAISDGDSIEFDTANWDFDFTDINTDYYPFLEISITSATSYWMLYIWDGDGTQTAIQTAVYDDGVFRYNIAAVLTDNEADWLRIYAGGITQVDYIKFYSIANFTFTGGSLDSDDYAYVESSALKFSSTITSPEYMTWNYDPVLSTATGTYNVLNVSMNDANPTGNVDFEFSATVGGSETLELTDETRDAFTDTGTLTDFRFTVKDGSIIISAIEFWEDSTAPTVSNYWVNPGTPDDDDSVTLTVYVTDGSGYDLYGVTFNALSGYPAGFSDVDYSASKNTDDSGVWDYTFSSLLAGDYIFKVYASDGAQNTTQVLPFTVVASEIKISNPLYIELVNTIQYTGEINRDVDYYAYEEDTLKTSGSISEGNLFSISWTKATASGTYDWGIYFNTSLYNKWINGSYYVAPETFAITDYTYDYNVAQIVVKGTPNKDGAYTLYHNDSSVDTGVFSEDTIFFVEWTRITTVGLHKMGLKCVNGSDTQWINGSYYISSTTLLITDTIYTITSVDNQISGYANIAFNYSIFENDTYVAVARTALAAGSFAVTWTKNTTVGLTRWAIKFNDTTTTRWINGSYYVSNTTLTVSNTVYTTNAEQNYLSGEVTVANTYTVYENDTQVGTGSMTVGSFSVNWDRNSTAGMLIWGVKFYDGLTTRWVNGSYYNAPATYDDLMISGIGFTAGTEEIAVFIQTNWNNATLHIYDNDTFKVKGNEGSLSYTNPQTDGLHQVGIYVNGTAQNLWVNFTYSVATGASLLITTLSFDSSGTSVVAFVQTNWGNTTTTIYENDVQKDTDSEGNTLSYVKATVAGTYNIGIKIDGTADSTWANYTYTVAVEASLAVDTINFGIDGADVTVFVSTNWDNCTVHIYENDVLKTSGNEDLTLSYTKATTAGDYTIGVYVNGSADNLWLNSTYTIASTDGLSVTSLSFDTSGVDVSIYVNTNWANTTITVYEDDVQKVTGSEGTISYTKTVAAGDYSVGIKIDGTAESVWANYTYTIAAENNLAITAISFDTSGTNVEVFVSTNWANTTLTVYEDDVQKDTGSEGATLSYTKATVSGDYDIGIKVDGTADSNWVNYTYTITADASMYLTGVMIDTGGYNISGFVSTNWGNATLTIYENDTQKGTGSEGTTLSYIKSTSAGNYRVSLYVDGTADSMWVNTTYTVSDIAFSLTNTESFLAEVILQVTGIINYASDYQVYSNDTLKESGSLSAGSVGVDWSKETTFGLHKWGIRFNTSTADFWHNGSYYIKFEVSIDPPEVRDVNIEVRGTVNIAANWYLYAEGVYDSQTGSVSPDTFSFFFTKKSTIGLNNYSIKFNITGSSVWKNGSYYVDAIYDWAFINIYGPDGLGLDPLLFKIYVNISGVVNNRIWSGNPRFYARTDQSYNITLTNVFDEEISSVTYSIPADRIIDVSVTIYTFKVYNEASERFYFYMTSAGGAEYSEHIMPGEIIVFYLIGANTYTYTFTVLDGPSAGENTGSITISDDTGIIIDGYSSLEIWQGVKRVGGGGSVSIEDLSIALNAVQGDILNQVQWYSWLTVVLIFVGLYAIPFIKRKGSIRGPKDTPEFSETYGTDYEDDRRTRRKKESQPKQLEPHSFKEGLANPNFRGKHALEDMSDSFWSSLKGERKGKKKKR